MQSARRRHETRVKAPAVDQQDELSPRAALLADPVRVGDFGEREGPSRARSTPFGASARTWATRPSPYATGTSPAAATRDFVLQTVSAIRDMPPESARGTLGYFAAISPAVNRLVLELTDRQATALAAAIEQTSSIAPEIARLRGIALAGVFQIIISESGRRLHEGQSLPEMADAILPQTANVLTELDRWLTR